MRLAPILLLLPIALQAGDLHAQEVARDTASPVTLPGLTVTVLSTPIEVTRAPYAVSVNGADEVRLARPGLGLDEALRGIPGVQVDNRYNYALGERISIRGFGARAQFGVRGVRVLVDAIPATFPDGQTSLSHVDLGLLARAEVVRGPASAIHGSSAGGVIQLETEAPPSGTIGQRVGLTVGSDGLLRLQSTTGGRAGRASYRLGLSRVEYDGYRAHSSAENTRATGMVGYLGDRSELRLTFALVDYDARNPGSLSDSLLRVDRSAAFANNVRSRTGEEGRQGQAGVSWTAALGPGELELSAYGIVRSVDNPIPATIVVLDRTVGGGRAAFRASTGRVDWSAGLEAALARDHRENYANVQGERGGLTVDQDEAVDNVAAFLQVSARPVLRLTVLGSLRQDWYRFRADDRLVSAGNPDDSGELSMPNFSPAIGASYELAPALHLYANVATSFETPTTTELANRQSGAGGFNEELRPQEAVSYEVGGKGALGWARYELSAYHADVRDELIPFEVAGAPGRSYFRNAGSGVHRGVEAALTVVPTAALRLRGAYSYTDARFDEYVTAAGDFGGNQLPGVAPHRVELALTGRARWGLFAAVEGRYVSELPVNDANSFRSPASTVIDARVGLERARLAGVALEPYAGITNLLNEEYNTSVVINAFGRRFYEPGPARAFYVGVNAAISRD